MTLVDMGATLVESSGTQGEPAFPLSPRLGFRASQPYLGRVRTVLTKPSFVAPMLPSLVLDAPAGDEWIHEIKFDGYRTLLVVGGGQARAFTRNGYDWSDSYQPIVDEAAKLRCQSAVLDGEIISSGGVDEAAFHGIKRAISRGGRDLVFVAFDLVFLDGKDFRTSPLDERREQLRRTLAEAAQVAPPVQRGDCG